MTGLVISSVIRKSGLVFVLALAGLVYAPTVAALTVRAGQSEIVFDEQSGTPQQWTVCSPDCDTAGSTRTRLLGKDDGYVRVTSSPGPGGAFSASVDETADEIIVQFSTARQSYRYRLSRNRPQVILELPPRASLEIATGESFIPVQMAGFGQLYSRLLAVHVSDAGQQVYGDPDAGQTEISVDENSWAGMRNRYWALLARPEAQPLNASIGLVDLDRPVISFRGREDGPTVIELYAGPIEWAALKSVSPVLSELLFAALWDFFRVLCFGMLMLLDLLYGIVGSYGFAIILLSLSVKILMTPLTLLAERWQADVNRIQTLLQPELDDIKRKYKGEQAHQLTLEVYKKHSVSPLYTFKSAAGFLIQIPVFIAAFDMLAENFALDEAAFLWINDLAMPDAVAELPFVIPFFGGFVNLLPFLMTALSSLAAWLQSEDSLSPELQRRQSLRLYLMSAAFFVLFYTFPSGMVLYWTSSNLFHLLKVEGGRLFKRA